MFGSPSIGLVQHLRQAGVKPGGIDLRCGKANQTSPGFAAIEGEACLAPTQLAVTRLQVSPEAGACVSCRTSAELPRG